MPTIDNEDLLDLPVAEGGPEAAPPPFVLEDAADVVLACDLTAGCEGVLHPNVDERAPGYAHFAVRCTTCGAVRNYGVHPLQRRMGQTDDGQPIEQYQDLGGQWRPLPA